MEGKSDLSPSLWSRRRILSTVAGAAAVPALPSILTLSATPAHAAPSAPGSPDTGLPDTEHGRAVWAYKTGGRAVREGAAAALLGTPAALTAFLTTELPVARAEDNRFAVLSSLSEAGRSVQQTASAALSAGDEAVAAFLRDGFAAPSWKTCGSRCSPRSTTAAPP